MIDFNADAVGTTPAGWTCGVTGKGTPKWTIEAMADAPSPPNVLQQSGSGTFPWCVRREVSLRDGFVEVQFKPIAGREDQAGGVVWRWKGGRLLVRPGEANRPETKITQSNFRQKLI